MVLAWELKEAKHYAKFLEIIHHDDCKECESSLRDNSIIDPKDLDGWDNDEGESMTEFSHEVYNKEILAYSTSNAQLAQCREEVEVCIHECPAVEGGNGVSFDVNQTEENH